jgi:lipopolysaccharide transport system ATP-binding protein
MSDIAIKFENISKQYRLGKIGTGTISHDLNRWWAKFRGKEDPYLKIGEVNRRDTKAEGDYVWALRDINLEVKKGEVLGIIGKNGAGKSTLLKLLSRVTAPTTGQILVNGRIASLLEVGTGFHPEMTGRENIFMNGAIMGMTKAEIRRKFDEIVDFAGVEKYIDTPVKRYSSGMTVRLGFAVAAHLEPEILVVDEVLAVGDAEFQKKAIGKMQDVSHEQGRTVLFVSHNMASIQALCTKSMLLHNGKVSYQGETDDVIRKYLEENTALKEKSIAIRSDRLGSGIAKLIDYRILDGNSKNSVDTIISGQKIILELTFLNTSTEVISGLEVGVGFFNKNEELLFACRNSALGQQAKLNQGKNVICIYFDKWPTSGGMYSFNVYTALKGEKVDWIKNVGKVKVETGDFYGYGLIPASNSQSVFINYRFSSL